MPSAFVRNDQPFERAGDEALVLDLEHDRYFGLNAVAADLWALLAQPRTVPELADALCARFQVDAATAAADVSHWTAELQRLGLIRPA